MKHDLGHLIAGTLAFWIVVVYPARWLGCADATRQSIAALLLCLVPAALTLAWGLWAAKGAPEQQMVMMLGGTMVRMGMVLASGFLLYLVVPGFHAASFWIWVAVFYLFTLALEIALLAGRLSANERPPMNP